MNGNITVNSACGILVDSTSTTGLSVIGNINITDTLTGVVGNYSSNGNVSFTPTPNAGIAAFADPLAGVPAPSVPTCTHDGLNQVRQPFRVTTTADHFQSKRTTPLELPLQEISGQSH